MELLVFGNAGTPVVVFPTSRGRFYDWEDRGMIDALAGRIDGGVVRLICVDSVDAESWYNYGAQPRERVQRHLAYERYILDEVVPFINESTPAGTDHRVALTGTSFGAFHAAVIAFRHPEAVSKMVAMSGMYDNSSFVHGYSDEDTYLTNPLAFLPGLEDPHYLDPLRRMQIVVVTGRDDPNVENAIQLAKVLDAKGIANTLDLWDGWAHDWPYWHEMVRKYF